ncbi:E3 ubiquitin-protein ligase ZNF598-like [Mercenaria mercenaria]|uniref:E3 ubiquitin-protein ligase ZNF598-like n=1 Tax=Mercenaria mercenaria TaxID=6596 RepID=UPI00234FB4BA|nr:E3 ubiquitin-protein ligase ZNF598-like [Mercenaria mercenaria]
MESSENLCLVCHEHIEIFAIGRCDHPICFKCSTRMRALCEQFYCPICRTDLPEVFFLKTLEKFGEMPMRKFIMNRKLKIQFEDESVRDRFEELLEHRCTKCPDRYPERNFKALRDHMRRVHTLFYCDLCLELKIFSSERKAYNRHDLAAHRRVGDKDDKSYKGHPLCQFCEERYLDKDELYKHLRKDHFFCHFCESLGSQEFYDDYPTLREHFFTEHYLCEEGECANAQFTNAFRSDIDLKSHQAHEHSKAQTKLQARQERTINIDINLVPRPNSRPQRGREPRREENEDVRRGGPRHQGNRGARSNRYNNTSYREKQDMDRAIQASLSTMKDEDMKKDKSKQKAESSGSSEDEFAHTVENFPALGAQPHVPVENNPPVGKKSQAPVSTVSSTAVSSTTTDSKPSLADRFAMSNSMSVQHGVLNDFPTLSPRSDSPKNALPPKGRGGHFSSAFIVTKTEEDFPGLPSSNKSTKPMQGSWTQPEKKVNVIPKPNTKRSNNRHKAPTAYDVNDFPTLGAPSNKSSNDKWFNNVFTAPSKVTSNTNNNNHKEMTTKEVLDRFSPVNVPDSPKTERTKNKKKKKKEKVTEIKNEETSSSGSLKGNSSLDDIASLLIKSDKKEEKTLSKKEESVEKTNEISNKVESKSDKSKGKKKIDKIEKKMETEKEVLNIAELKISDPDVQDVQPRLVKFAVADEDFPVLGSKSPPKKPPPGFKQEEPVKSSAPPGFSKPVNTNNKPPPGFGSQNVSGNFKNGIVEEKVLPMSVDIENYQYSQPDGFQERNQLLIGTVKSFCAADSMQFPDFKTLSGEFRRSEITSAQYYNRCCDILGKDNFLEVFPELLALLPDIDKQQELLTVYLQSECMKKDDKMLKISGKSKNAKGAWMKTQSGFLTCQTCRQVLTRRDYNSHMTLHNIDSDFPSLGVGLGPSQKVAAGGAWVKAK